jgi:hypothetical protein
MSRYKWIRITDPDGQQKELFTESKAVYEQLFQPRHREKFSHFRKYILDAEKSRRREKTDRPLDGYYVGCIDSEVQGMALVTSYKDHRLGFISYYGVLRSDTQQGKLLAGKGYQTIKGELWKDTIDAFLTEVENIPLAYLQDRQDIGKRDEWTELRRHFLRSIQEKGARKISFIDYLQPILDVDSLEAGDEASDLHLMVVDTAPTGIPDEDHDSRRRRTIVRYIDFVYNVFYKDGFDVSDEADAHKAKEYLFRLSRRVLKGLPKDLERVPLGRVALDPFGIRTMISYRVREGTQLMRLLCRYLTDMGVHVINWEEDARGSIGKPLKGTVFGMVRYSDVVIALLTPGFLTSKGMQEELNDASKMGKRVIPLVDGDASDDIKKRLVGLLKKILGETVVYSEFQRRHFHLAVHDLEKTLTELVRAKQ